ncbi:tape measure protein [Providencia rettgeri]
MTINAGNIEIIIKADTDALLVSNKKAEKSLDELDRGFSKTTKSVNTTEKSILSFSKAAVAVSSVLSASTVANYADAWTDLSNKLANSIRQNEKLADVTERVFDISQKTRSSLNGTASLYARLERATREYGTSVSDIARLTEIINQGFVVSGATAQEAENAIIQLSQGLASGALRGEEFNSVNEQGNRLIVALADSMGVGIGKMREMAAQGKLTTDVVVNGLLSQGNSIGKEFANTTATMSQSIQTAGNNLTKFFGESTTVQTGISVFNSAIVTISENMNVVSGVLIAVAAIMGGRFAGAMYLATQNIIKNTAATYANAAAQGKMAAASMAAKSALGLIGGPAGAAILAASAVFYFYQKSQEAKQEALAFADSIEELKNKMKDMSDVALMGNIAEASKSIDAQKESIQSLKDELEILQDNYSYTARNTAEYQNRSKNLEKIQRDIAIKTKELEEAQNKLARTTKYVSDATQELTDRNKDLYDAMNSASGVAGKMGAAIGALQKKIKAAADEKARLNSEMRDNPETDDGKKAILNLQEQNELLRIKDGRLRAIRKAEMEADKVTSNPKQRKLLIAEATANYDLTQAERERTSSAKSSAKTTDEAGDSLQRLQERLARLSQGYEENSLQMAKYDAVQSLGAKAAPEQIALAEKKAEAIWKMEEAVRNLAQAEQGRKYANQEIAAGKVAENPYTDTAEDPLAQINLQEQQKLEALEKYRLIDTENAQLYEDAKTAIMQQATYDRERILKQEQDEYKNNMAGLLGSTSEFASSLAGALGDAVGESNAAYKALFAVSKAFAIAQASLNLQTAIGNALAMPWPANIPAIAQAMAAGSQLVNAVRGVNYGGRRYGGNVSGGNQYRINESGESEIFQTYDGKQAFIPNKSGKVIPADKASNGAANISVTIIHTGQPFSVEDQRVKQGNDGQMMLELITRSIDEGSTVSQAIERNFNTNRRARGGY